MKKFALLLICLLCTMVAQAQYNITSPDGRIRVSLIPKQTRNLDTKVMRTTRMKMSVFVDGKIVVDAQEINLMLYAHGHRYTFGKSDFVNSTATTRPVAFVPGQGDEAIAGMGNRCNRMVVQSATGITLEVLAFDTGVAYRFSVEGMDGEYKILNATDVFPYEKPNAIVGTFTGDQVLPWRTMRIGETEEQAAAADVWEQTYPSRKLVSWRDALSSVSVGMTTNWMADNAWKGPSQSHGIYVDYIYKHLYGGLSFTPCHQLLYVYWEGDYAPFTNVMGSIHSWDVTARFGYNLPVQFGYNVWSFAPYATATYLALRQHDNPHPGFQKLSNRSHTLVGLGLKVQYMMHERISLGVGYEYQFFTGSMEPTGRSTLLLSIGYCL